MSISIKTTNNASIKTKEYLINELNSNRKMISDRVYNKLLRLIKLEDSALKEEINQEDLLKEVSFSRLFLDIVTYNIYMLTHEYSKVKPEIELDNQCNNIKLKYKGNRLLEFYHDDSYDHNPTREVYLYQTVYDPEYNDMLDEKLSKELEEEYKKDEFYESNRDFGYDWLYKHQQRIDKLIKELKDHRDRNIPTEKEKEELQELEEVYNSLVDYYEIKNDGFVEKENYGDIKRKTLAKTVNNVKVFNNIKYI